MNESTTRGGVKPLAGAQNKLGGFVATAMEIVYVLIGAVVGLVIGYIVKGYLAQRRGEDVETAAQAKADELLKQTEGRVQAEIEKAKKAWKEREVKIKKQQEAEQKKKKQEIERLERQLEHKIERIDQKSDALEKREEKLRGRETEIDKLKADGEQLLEQQRRELERIAGLSPEIAKEELFKRLETELNYDLAVKVNEHENRLKETCDKKAREVLATSIQRCATDHTIDPLVSVVELPNEEMKGRIIGREGRNIRTFENLTGVDVIIDDTPEAVVLSGFEPIKREVARTAMELLTLDGRIHPAKIEEMVEKAQKEVSLRVKEAGEQAVLALGLQGVPPEVVEIIGRLNFRTSYGQNVLQHSIEVATLASNMAAELGANAQLARRAGLLHDIGKVIESDEGNHAALGADFARKFNEIPKVVNAIAAHHEDVPFETVEAVLIAAADAISAARRGARSESLDAYIKRLEGLESVATSFKGVAQAYANQAGREIRVMVRPEEIDDVAAPKLCRDIVKKIEAEMEYPGQVKVVVIRETRTADVAR